MHAVTDRVHRSCKHRDVVRLTAAGGGSETAADQKPDFTLSLSPTTSPLRADTQIDAVAPVAGTSPQINANPTLVWTSPDGGTVVAQPATKAPGLTAIATFVAPTSPANYRVIATLKEFPATTQTAVMTVDSSLQYQRASDGPPRL